MEEYSEEYTIDTNDPVDPGIIICSACLCSDRDLYCINTLKALIETFHLLMYDYVGENATDMYDKDLYVCWECQALLERFCKFKWQVRSAQKYIQGLADGVITESIDHTYTTKCLSSLEIVHRNEYDKTYIDVSDMKQDQKIISIVSIKKPIPVELKPTLAPKMTSFKPETIIGTDKTTGKSKIVIGTKMESQSLKPRVSNANFYVINSNTTQKITGTISNKKVTSNETVKATMDKVDTHYVVEHMTEDDMYKSRELSKQQPPYLCAPFKCMLCVIGLNSQELLEEHFLNSHSAKPDHVACQICHRFVGNSQLSAHTDEHYLRFMCKHCAHVEYSVQEIRRHVKTHNYSRRGVKSVKSDIKRRGSVSSDVSEEFPGPGTKRTRDSYVSIRTCPCPDCDMVFNLARKLRTHIDRHHREGIICDNCKRRFVNKTTLIEHLRLFCPVLHPDPPPQEECPICHKMVRVVYLKGHIRRHQNKKNYECKECNKTFSDYTNYKGHLKYSRAHATEFKYRCPMCEKGYSSKVIMQDHFNYQHLGKTSHKCPVCDKALATRRCVVQHVARAHRGAGQPAPAPYVCDYCGKKFKHKRILREHTTIHTGERPLACQLCGASFRHAAALRTHLRRLHPHTTPSSAL